MTTIGASRNGDGNEPATVSDRDQNPAQSDLAFPYSDLAKAIELVRTMDDKAAGHCSYRQLAAWLSLSVNGGTMRARYSAARMFGLVAPVRDGRAKVTDLGNQVLSAEARVQGRAKAIAFLNVPLYQEIYGRREGYPLPPAQALDQMVQELGVPPKQARRARQAFVKSAADAGFIDRETRNFIQPVFPDAEQPDSQEQHPSEETPSTPAPGGNGSSDDIVLPGIDPIVMGLIRRLPKSGEVWPISDRKLWLGILEATFKLVYSDPEEEGVPTPTAGPG